MAIDPQYYGYYQQGLLDEGVAPPDISGPDFVRGMKYAPFDLLGAPVDLANMALSPLGLGSDMPVGGSDYLINKYADLGDLLGINYDRPTGSGSETLGRITSGILAPTVGAKTVGRVVQGVGDYVAGAPARVADRARSVTLGSGIDPTSIVDDLIVRGMGDNGGPPMVPEAPVRDVDELGFYSQALEVAQGLKQKKGTGQQFEAMLLKGGVKPDEIAFTPGLRGLLDQPQVTQEELVGLLQDQRIRPQETVFYDLGFEHNALNFPDRPEVLSMEDAYGADFVSEEIEQVLEYDLDDALALMSRTNPSAYPESDLPKIKMAIEEEGFLPQSIMEDVESAAEEIARTNYEYNPVVRLQDPDTGYEIIGDDVNGYYVKDEGGEHIEGYQRGEVGIFGSLSEARIQADAHARERGFIGGADGEARFAEYTEPGGHNYREILLQVPEYEGRVDDFYEITHFDEPNIAVHARTTDRKMAKDAGEVLYVEELQSDWGQQGRQVGFAKPEDADLLDSLEKKIEPIRQKMHKADYKVRSLRERAIDDIASSLGLVRGEADVRPDFYRYGNLTYPDGSKAVGAADLLDLLNGRKAAIYPQGGGRVDRFLGKDDLPDYYRKAVDEFDVFADKFDPISEQIDDLEARVQPAPFIGSSEKFAEVGIKRLLSRAVEERKGYVSFSPGDIQYDRWGEEGLETFYDKIIPKAAQKVVKKLDKEAKVGPMKVRMDGPNDTADRFTIEITPKMREAIRKGIPLFTTGGAGLLGAGMAREERPQTTEGIL